MSNINDMFEQDAGALVVKNEDLQSVGELAKRAKQLEKEIEELEDTVKERKEQQRKLLEESIPGRLSELGMKSFKMSDGSQIDIKAFYNASIKEENRARPMNGCVVTVSTTSSRTRCLCALVEEKTNCARHY